MCSDDTRLANYINEAVMRLLPKGKWVGTTARMRICVNSNCLTWPRQIETIETFSICGVPGTVRSQWYEFADFGPGQQNGSCGTGYLDSNYCSGNNLIDRGTACAFDDIAETGNRLKLYADLPEDDGVEVLVQGWDENGNWILTNGGNTNGESVQLSGFAAVTTQSKFLRGGLTAIQKPITKGPVRLYDWNPTTGVQRPLGIYEPDETVPEYRRSYVPGLSDDYRCCGQTDESCTKKTVYVIGKLKFIPVRNDTDYVLIGNIPALKDMCQSIKKREDNLMQEAVLYEASAIKCLEDELSSYYGDSTVDPVRAMNAGNFAMAGVTSLL